MSTRPPLTMVEFLEHPDLGQQVEMFRDLASWRPWYAVFRGADAEPLERWSPEDLGRYRAWTGRTRVPSTRPQVVVVIGPRQGGKTTAASLRSAVDIHNYRPKGRGGRVRHVVDVAQRQESARDAVGDARRDIVYAVPALRDLVVDDTEEGLTFSTKLVAKAFPTQPRAVRSVLAQTIILDEPEHWIDADPEAPSLEKMLAAALPATLNTSGQTWVVCTPWMEGGALDALRAKYWGVDDAPVLVYHVQDSPKALNPSIDERVIDLMVANDPLRAEAEVGGRFMKAVSGWCPREVIEACVVRGAPPLRDLVEARGYIDMSKLVHDSSALVVMGRDRHGVVHVLAALEERAGGVPSYDFIRDVWKPVLQHFRCAHVPMVGDQVVVGPIEHLVMSYGLPRPLMASWKKPTLNRERRYDPDPATESRMTTNDAAAQALPALYAGDVRIYHDGEPGSPTGRLISQLKGLHRRLKPGGIVEVAARGDALDDLAVAGLFGIADLWRGSVAPKFKGISRSGVVAALDMPLVQIGKPRAGIAGRVGQTFGNVRLRGQKRDHFHHNDQR